MVKTKVILYLTIICFFSSCNKTTNRPKPNVSAIKVDIKLQRFDTDLMSVTEQNFDLQKKFMQRKYGSFYPFYVSQFVIGPRPVGDTATIEKPALLNFVIDGYIRRLQDSINVHFKNNEELEKELTQAIQYFKYYFPEIMVPKVITINSGFSLGAFTFDKDVLGIGLDQYLGAHNPDYDSAGVYSYVQHKMSPNYITRNSIEVLSNFYFGDEQAALNKPLIEAMIDKGKKLYVLSYCLPDAPDSILVGYTSRQTAWCENSEYEIWKFLNDKDLLYKSDYMEKKRYLDEGPTTAGMPADAPGNIGSWIGLQIVRKFMQETGGKITLKDLIVKYDSKVILEKSKYRPAKNNF